MTPPTDPIAPAGCVRFWRTMNYRCNDCGRHLLMRLEYGCEGPRDEERVIVIPAGPMKGQPGVAFVTNLGRIIQPVPFGVRCKCGKSAMHVTWNQDADLDLVISEDLIDFPHFRYDPSEDPHACGIPRNTR